MKTNCLGQEKKELKNGGFFWHSFIPIDFLASKRNVYPEIYLTLTENNNFSGDG